MKGERFLELQKGYFAEADVRHFTWQTEDPYLSATECELLARARIDPAATLLEIGCGEGANLANLGDRAGPTIGLDYSQAKVAWGARRLPGRRFLCADASSLPIAAGSADVVLCRDVLHHVADKSRVVAEMVRVLRPGGRLVVIEPNGRNPVVRLQSVLVRAERELRHSTAESLSALLDEAGLDERSLLRLSPMPLGRALFHYHSGIPGLSRSLGRPLRRAEELIGRVLPKSRWAYILLLGRRPETSRG